jgi:hypothetical protein
VPHNNYGNIPREMTFYRQWVTWRYEEQDDGKKPTKVLYNPLFNGHASVNKPETFVSYDEAVDACRSNPDQWAGIGFVLTENDPYCFVDLDDIEGDPETGSRQKRVFDSFESYAEWSPSGTGLHIICKGAVDRGRKRSKIEIYSNLRFMTMTGNVMRDAPIIDEDQMCKLLFHDMGGAATLHDGEVNYGAQTADDATVIHRMFTAENGIKTKNIFDGNWRQYVGTWSEADQALINVIVYFTKNKAQIIRIFQSSQPGSRKKAYRVDYLDRTIGLAFDRTLPPIDDSAFLMLLTEAREDAARLQNSPTPEGPNAGLSIDATAEPGRLGGSATDAGNIVHQPGPVNSSVPIPPGLIGEIAAFIYEASPRPVAEASLVAALGLVAGIAGRAYNVSGSGLNQYLLFLAPTGTGKEAINSGISKLLHAAVKGGSPRAFDFIGPGQIRSDAALLKWFTKQTSFLSIVGEFGLRLKAMSAERPSHETAIKTVLLDLYSKSGANQTLNATAYSDKEKTVEPIKSPNFCMIGESTGERFYETLDESMIYEGLLPRFTIFEFSGDLPTWNKRAGFAVPPLGLVNQVAALISMVKSRNESENGPINVGMTNDADMLFDKFNAYCESMQRGAGVNELVRGVWSRAWMKAAKLAATVAIGFHMHAPEIDKATAEWATKIIANECTAILAKFDGGAVGEHQRSDDVAQYKTAIRVIKRIALGDAKLAKSYRMSEGMHKQGWLPHTSLVMAIGTQQAFRKAFDPGRAVANALKLMTGLGELIEVPTDQVIKQLNVNTRCYAISDPKTLFAEN